ncbi:1-deoxy-D-xylulose-5-phosphate synthase [Aquimarina sp. 2201CG14-23]|uniref:1-deoxy-D-xylulose-5-phosphate synthase n=1 Tax=Aquimarina mycalae TaxID=3040073 RepID=UPI002478202E|nr:1-deoxy-D-xylulose-5-phosphate synthase [Aquimarina sp. 2201CG14-23]MDH7448374.1 1-deoxy-D-xylulose-5-phosphate synthase [Aquimarina sp. 2201CG14-23]
MKDTLLSHIKYPSDLRKLSVDELPYLAKELRDFVIDIVATKEGHLGASLGVIELTIALHYVFDTPNDLLVWDVGHQAYPHKILTGRKNLFHTNRQLDGISGFPKRSESNYDTFGVGHSSTSISATLGMAIASKLKGDTTKQHIAVIGDASIASGMAFEGLNHAGVTDTNMLIILNDNSIGIDPSVGALKEYLTKAKVGYKPKTDNIIEALSFEYFGPIDGHNLPKLLATLERLKTTKGPKLLHIITTKGKGLKQAEENQVTYHAPGKFDATTGDLLPKESVAQPPKFQDVFGYTILELAKVNKKIVGITPAMPTGSSLKYMMEEMPDRAFDVGIAEQHAVTLAAGMATQGLIPFCTIYSTFLQRAYDQLIHDVALQNLPVIFCIDRAGIVGADGATHHGVFDIAYLNCIPNMIIAAPSNEIELRNLLYTSSLGLEQPIAIRYPRGRGTIIDWQLSMEQISIGKGTCLIDKKSDIAIVSTGTIATNITDALKTIEENVSHYHFCFVKPLDSSLLQQIFQKHKTIITVEDGVVKGGFGSSVIAFANDNNFSNKITTLGVPDQFIHHGTTQELYEICGISSEKIQKVVLKAVLSTESQS